MIEILKEFYAGNAKPASGGGSSGASSLAELSDVSITSPSTGDTIIYNEESEKWENGVASVMSYDSGTKTITLG